VFQDELVQLIPFSARCSAHLVPLGEAFIETLPPEKIDALRLAGMRQMQQGVFNTLSATLTMLVYKEMDEAHLVRIARAVARSASAYASIMSLAMRDQVKNLAAAAQPWVTAEQAALLAQVVLGMQDPKCGKVCEVNGE
jgi:hypothetical protein